MPDATMEATSIYWKPVWHILEGSFELILANANHVRNVPGRKTDVNDATWLADLAAHGLVRASFVPPTLNGVAFSPGGAFVYATSQTSKEHIDNELVAWRPGDPPRRVVCHDEMTSLSVSPDGLLLAVGTKKGRLSVWVVGDDVR